MNKEQNMFTESLWKEHSLQKVYRKLMKFFKVLPKEK